MGSFIIVFFLFFPYFFQIFLMIINNPDLFYIFFIPPVSLLLISSQKKIFQTSINPEDKPYKKIINIYTLTGVFLYALSLFAKCNILKIESLCTILYGLLVMNYSGRVRKTFIFPCFYMIFFYPWEIELSFLIPLMNTFYITTCHLLFSLIGIKTEIVPGEFRIITPDFIMNVIPSCSGLDLTIVCIIFFSIYAYRSGMSFKSKIIWMLSIPLIITLMNTLRIFFMTLSGIMKWGIFNNTFIHYSFSFVMLIGIFLCLKQEEKFLSR